MAQQVSFKHQKYALSGSVQDPLSGSVPKVYGVYSGPRPIPPSEFCQNGFSSFYVILLTNQQPANNHTSVKQYLLREGYLQGIK